MQVAKECMPMSSLVVGVDLVSIKPVAGCIGLQGDITTEKVRTDLKKELKTAKADVVLHDGAPNVGKNWINDAYQQSLLTLSAFKLASEFLKKGGWFVTKIFRSKDYQSLIWVFGQFFKKVHATKPAASRNESAEIFVVCQGYTAPEKIDPKFLDPRHVFSEVEDDSKKANRELVNPEKKKKAPSEGYADGATVLYTEAKASDFIMGDNQVQILNSANQILLDTPRIVKHQRTTQEVKECCKDLKVLGMKELRLLKKWRDALRKEFEEEDKKNEDVPDATPAVLVKTREEEEDEELAAMDKAVEEVKDEERRVAKRKKKKELREKQKRVEKVNLKMIIPGDEGPTHQEENLFKMTDMKTAEELDEVLEQGPEMVAEESDEEEVVRDKYEKYDKEDGVLDSQGLWYAEGEEKQRSEKEESDEDGENLGLVEDGDDEEAEMDDNVEEQDMESANPLLPTLEKTTVEERRARKAEMWFDKPGLADLDDDSDVEEEEVTRAMKVVEMKGGKIRKKQEKVKKNQEESGYTSGSDVDEAEENNEVKENQPAGSTEDTDSDSDSEDEEKEFEVVPQAKGKKRSALSYEELALGEKLIHSKKSRRDIMEGGWNRFMFDDTGLPDWFVKEEEMHMRMRLDVDPETA